MRGLIDFDVCNHVAMSGEILMFVCNLVAKSREILMFVCLQKDAKQFSDATTLESIHTKDESKCVFTFAFFFGVN